MISKIKSLFGSRDPLQDQYKRYEKLHNTTFWQLDDIGTDLSLIGHAYTSIASGYTVEEALLRNLLFMTAYKIDHCNDPRELPNLIKRTATNLELMKPWADMGLIKAEIWGQDSETIMRLIKFDGDNTQLIAKILTDLYRAADALPKQFAPKFGRSFESASA